MASTTPANPDRAHTRVPPPTRATVRALQQVVDYPAVTLITDSGEGERADLLPDRLNALAKDAERRLREEFGRGHHVVGATMEALAGQIGLVDPSGHPGVAVFASSSLATWHPITEPCEERVVIDNTFATRDLVHAQLRSTDTWVLHLAAPTRAFTGSGHRFAERRGTNLPFTPDDKPADPEKQHLREPSNLRDRDLAREMRELDSALEDVLSEDPRPVIIVGSERRLAAFETHSRHAEQVVARIQWGGRHLEVDAVDELVGAAVDGIIERRTGAAMGSIDAAIKAGRLTTGVQNCWIVAQHGLADLVVVEQGFSEAGWVDAGSGEVTLTADREAPRVVDDLVDELIEQVLACRGDVAIVADGTLAEHQRIAICGRA